MIVKLTRAARIPHEAGEIVEVSPDFAHILFSQGAAVIVTNGEKNDDTNDTNETGDTNATAAGDTGDTNDTGDAPAPKAKKTKKTKKKE